MHTTKREWLRAALVCAFAWACASCGGIEPRVEGTVLVVGSDLDNMPFAGVDRHGAPIGRDVEMMNAVAALLGKEIRWQRMAFEELLPAVESGDVDVVCATIGVTPERAQRVAFSRPYFETSIAAVVKGGSSAPTSVSELRGLRVAAARGTTSERAVRRRLAGTAPILENKDNVPGAERLERGEVDALIMDGPAADALVGSSGGALRRISEDLAVEQYALVVGRSARRLVGQIDECIAEMVRSGQMKRLDQRYGLR